MPKHIELNFRLTEYDESGESVTREVRFDGHNSWQQMTASKGAFTEEEVVAFNKLLSALEEIIEAK